jgi:hypothetical protein
MAKVMNAAEMETEISAVISELNLLSVHHRKQKNYINYSIYRLESVLESLKQQNKTEKPA